MLIPGHNLDAGHTAPYLVREAIGRKRRRGACCAGITRASERIRLTLLLQIIRRVRESLTYIGELEPSVRVTVIDAYADSVHIAQWFTAGLTACALLASFFIKETQLTK